MSDYHRAFKTVDELLDQLLDNAKELEHLSEQTLAEEELVELQKKQEEIVGKLMKADERLKDQLKHEKENVKSACQDVVQRKLEQFEQINERFIENLSVSHGVLDFHITPKNGEEEA